MATANQRRIMDSYATADVWEFNDGVSPMYWSLRPNQNAFTLVASVLDQAPGSDGEYRARNAILSQMAIWTDEDWLIACRSEQSGTKNVLHQMLAAERAIELDREVIAGRDGHHGMMGTWHRLLDFIKQRESI